MLKLQATFSQGREESYAGDGKAGGEEDVKESKGGDQDKLYFMQLQILSVSLIHSPLQVCKQTTNNISDALECMHQM